jgi:retron-type reverse transcriptase
MIDRAQQALHLLALDPVVETTADKNSYGFRQQRSCADAIEQCFTALSHAPNTQWILEGDIKSCFDKISHDWLLAQVPMDRTILQMWLKSGYMEKHVLHETSDRTPQGGIISPALANCALDGLERLLKEKYPTGKALKSLQGSSPAYFRLEAASPLKRRSQGLSCVIGNFHAQFLEGWPPAMGAGYSVSLHAQF